MSKLAASSVSEQVWLKQDGFCGHQLRLAGSGRPLRRGFGPGNLTAAGGARLEFPRRSEHDGLGGFFQRCRQRFGARRAAPRCEVIAFVVGKLDRQPYPRATSSARRELAALSRPCARAGSYGYCTGLPRCSQALNALGDAVGLTHQRQARSWFKFAGLDFLSSRGGAFFERPNHGDCRALKTSKPA